MNTLLLLADDFVSDDTAIIRDTRRCEHICSVHSAKVGDPIKVGMLNGKLGSALITSIDKSLITFEAILLDKNPPAALPLTLILGLPRPKMLKRILQTIATLGVKKLVLLNSYRVEKSYWQTPWLTPEAIRAQLILGLEQGCDTLLPEVRLVKRFKPFVEDELPELIAHSQALVAHPYTAQACPTHVNSSITLAIGPEGGFIPYEIGMLEVCGFETVQVGERIMRVETAVPFLLGRLLT